MKEVKRHADLDWIKVLATLVVFLYHCSMFFNQFAWHVKNNIVNHTYILAFTLAVSAWIMPVFFVISGIGTVFSLRSRSGSKYLKERFSRLGIPLLFGVFILSPPQVYIERITHHQFEGSFWSFFPHYFDGVYLDIGGTGNFAFVGLHLWYLLVLLVFSIFTLPYFKRMVGSEEMGFSFKHYFFLPLIFFVTAGFLNFLNLGSWGIVNYLVLYIYGFMYFSRESFREFVRGKGTLFGVLSLGMTTLFVSWFMIGFPLEGPISLGYTALRVLSCWNSILFIFYLGDKFLTTSNSFLKYGSKASMPFYVVHQPVIVFIGYFIYRLDWPVAAKLIFLIVIAFITIMLIYQFIIQKSGRLGVLFGIKDRKKELTTHFNTNQQM